MKSAMVCQPLSKFGIFTFLVSYIIVFVVLFSLNGVENKIFGFLVRENKKGRQFSKKGGEEGK